jgi:hypothetical protein
VAEARSPVLANEPQPLADGAYRSMITKAGIIAVARAATKRFKGLTDQAGQ